MRNIIRALLACAVLAPVTAASDEGLSGATSSLSQGWTFGEQGGAALFAGVCAGCHQPDARGASGAGAYPSLIGDSVVASPEYLEFLLFTGRRGMPPLGAMMTDQQMADVINYVRGHFGNAYPDEVSADQVKAARPYPASAP
jgi:mono/diheme cytochrome c family protein